MRDIDYWTKLDLQAFAITMAIAFSLGLFEVSFSATLIIGLASYVGLRLLQGMR